ncbi:uncharacterized protein LOC112350010 [Selaginella moellendorffii]|uniref:uncharacterized protein LOC112350010 n=1 Tax=Selaginella moellendorffii TaxID=88036 RepID=UPI000D1CDDD0|nr:uncharacterized protein LOC112350010 [Selaginella moellendorffii]|eukprot:XP_024541193.1 uncharacterized protein LOC112350010 [Selaginella moellendorffii]
MEQATRQQNKQRGKEMAKEMQALGAAISLSSSSLFFSLQREEVRYVSLIGWNGNIRGSELYYRAYGFLWASTTATQSTLRAIRICENPAALNRSRNSRSDLSLPRKCAIMTKS